MALTRITKGVIKPNENYDTHDINSTGIITATGANITGNMTVGGVLTYEDVTSIDSVGLITARNGIDCNGDLDVDGHTNLDNVSIAGLTTANQLRFLDNKYLQIGNSQDLQLYHDGNHSYVNSYNGTGNLYVSGNSVRVQSNDNRMASLTGTDIIKTDTTTAYLYHNGSVRMQTNAVGVTINRDLDVDGHTNLDNVSIVGVTTFTGSVGASGQIQSTYNHASQPRLYLSGISGSSGYNYLLRGDNDGGSKAVHFVNGSARSADNGANTYTIRNDNGKLHLGRSNQLAVLQGSTTYLQHGTSTKLQTSSTGVTVTGTVAATSFTGDGSNLTGINSDLVNDSSPQLGGNLDVNSKSINFGDSNGSTTNIAKFGASDDLVIYHNGNHSKIIDMGTGNLYLESDVGSIYLRVSDNEQGVTIHQDGAVELYHNNAKKFETTNTGATVTGRLVSDGLDVGDSESIRFGTGYDMNMYHDGSNGVINNGTGGFYIFGGNGAIYLRPSTDDEHGIVVNPNSSVQLYHNGIKSLETTTEGIEIKKTASGQSARLQIEATNGGQAGIELRTSLSGTNRAARIDMYNQDTLQWSIFNDYQQNGTNDFSVRHGAEMAIRALPDSQVELYHDNSKKLQTTSAGVQITGALNVTTTMHIPDGSIGLQIGNSNDLMIRHDGNNSIISHNGTGDLLVNTADGEKIYIDTSEVVFRNAASNETLIRATQNDAVKLYFNNTSRLETTNIGAKVNCASSVDGLLVTASQEGTVTVEDQRDSSYKASFLMAGSGPVIRNQNTNTSDNTLAIQKGGSTKARWDGNGHYLPGSNNTYDLGGSSTRWRNIYGGTLSLSSYAVLGSLVVNDPGSSYYSFNNRIGGNTIIKGTTVCTDDIGSTIPSTFPASNVQLMVYTSTLGQPINNTDCARLVIATDAKNVGVQGYHGSLDFGSSDASASTGSNEFSYRTAAIMCRGDGDTSSTIADGDLQFYTKTSSGSLTHRFDIAPNGDLTGTDTSIGNLSDQRLKTNIQDYTYDLNKFKQLKTRTFDWINPEFHQEGNIRGFIAQEIETVDPYWNYQFEVSKETAEKDYDLLSDGDENYTITDHRPGKASKLNGKDAMYVSVIQQLMSKIETLETKVAALEG